MSLSSHLASARWDGASITSPATLPTRKIDAVGYQHVLVLGEVPVQARVLAKGSARLSAEEVGVQRTQEEVWFRG